MKPSVLIKTFVILYMLVLFMGCSLTPADKLNNLLNKAHIEYVYTQKKGVVKRINIVFDKSIKINNMYLYLDAFKDADFYFNSNADSIIFNPEIVQKYPFTEVKMTSDRDLDFKLIYFNEKKIKSIHIVPVRPIRDSRILLRTIAVIDSISFNSLFKNIESFTFSDLPALTLNSKNSITDKKQSAELFIENERNKPNFQGNCTIKVRGQTSKKFAKKNYKITLVDSISKNKALLGMPADHDWILHGPYLDISLIRNKFTYDLYRKMGNYASRMEFCELVINNEYLGVYLLSESIKADKNRVNIEKNFSDSTSKFNYIVKIDKGDDAFYRSRYKSQVDSGINLYYYTVYPKKKKMDSKGVNFLKKEIHRFETALNNDTENYFKYIDVQSFVDYFLLNELTKDIDAFRLSNFIYKGDNNKMVIGPPWDYNSSLGLIKAEHKHPVEGWMFDRNNTLFWYRKLMQQESFASEIKKRWFELRANIISEESICNDLNIFYQTLEPVSDRNFNRWNSFNKGFGVREVKVKSFKKEYEYLEEWLKKRINWMDDNINKL